MLDPVKGCAMPPPVTTRSDVRATDKPVGRNGAVPARRQVNDGFAE
jgi:hypothetical protein